jgi:hypothetical protein
MVRGEKMNIRRLQGMALILSAVCLLLGALSLQPIILITIGLILFILGTPAIYSVQPTVWMGLLGIVLLELAALIALGFRLQIFPSSLSDGLSLTSAVLGMLGAVIVGWLTTRAHVFPYWVGWVFMVQGLLNFITGLFNIGAQERLFFLLIAILQTVASFTYGYLIYQITIS